MCMYVGDVIVFKVLLLNSTKITSLIGNEKKGQSKENVFFSCLPK